MRSAKHFDDQALSDFLAGHLTEADTRKYRDHLQSCNRCARPFEHWRALFPQLERLLELNPTPAAVQVPGGPTLILPDRDSEIRLRKRLGWTQALAIFLALVLVGLLAFPAVDGFLRHWAGGGDLTDELGAGVGSRHDSAGGWVRLDSDGTIPVRDTSKPLGATFPEDTASPAVVASVLVDTAPLTVSKETAPAPVASKAPPPRSEAVPQRLVREVETDTEHPSVPPPAFHAATLDEARAALGGVLKEIDGLERQSIEIGPGSLVPGASPDLDLVRIAYLGRDSTTVTLIQQRLAPGQADATGRMAVTTGPNGQRMARWADPSGVWLELLTWGDRERLFELANTVE